MMTEQERRPRHHLTTARKRVGATQQDAADAVGVAVGTWARWEQGVQNVRARHRPAIARFLGVSDGLLDGWLGPEDEREGSSPEPTTDKHLVVLSSSTEEAIDILGRLGRTNVSNETLAMFETSTRRLVNDYLRRPPLPLLVRAADLSRRLWSTILDGRQRMGQTRELYLAAGRLAAFQAWAAGDLGDPYAADAQGRLAWACAEECDHPGLRAWALSVQSKTAFWDGEYFQAAQLAAQGQQYSAPGTARVMLACQEADAWQAQGDVERARAAVRKVEEARDSVRTPDDLGGLFSCGPARQANYAIYVHLTARDAKAALATSERALQLYDQGDEWAYGTWAQILIGQSLAYLSINDLDGAAESLTLVLSMPPEKRLDTLNRRLGQVNRLLSAPRLAANSTASTLRAQISSHQADAFSARQLPGGM